MNYLYFYEGTSASNAGVSYPASALRCAEQTGDGTISLHFTPLAITAVATGAVTDAITLTVTSGKEKEVMEAIAKVVNENVSFSGGFVVIADDENGVYAHENIIDIKAEEASAFSAITFAS